MSNSSRVIITLLVMAVLIVGGSWYGDKHHDDCVAENVQTLQKNNELNGDRLLAGESYVPPPEPQDCDY